MPEPTDIYDMELDEVALVQRGDNKGAHISFYKKAPDDTTEGEPMEEPSDNDGVIKRVLKAVGSAFGWSEEDVQKAEAVAYEPPDFEQIQADKFRYKIEDELWEYIASLQSAMIMALSSDADTESKMRDSLSQFDSAMNDAISSWSAGKSSMAKGVGLEDVDKAGRKISGKRLKNLKDARDALHRVIEEAEPEGTVEKDGDEGMVETDVTEPIEKAAPKTLAEALSVIKDLQAQLAEAKKGSSSSSSSDKKPGGTGGGTKGKVPPQFKKDEPDPDEIFKDASPEMRAYLQKIQADREADREIAKADRERVQKMEQEKEEGEYIAKARADHLADPEEIGKAMRRLDKGAPKEGDFEKVQKAYQAVIAQASTAELFKQRGSGMGGGSGSALAEATQKAQELRKSNPSLSMSAARAKVWETNPDLAEKYREEAS